MKRILLVIYLVFLISKTFGQAKKIDSWTDGKFIKVNKANIWVVTVSEGDPIILIAGGPGQAHPGMRSFDQLADGHHQLIYFDAFGRGKSDTARNLFEYTLERDIDDVEGLRKALKLDHITVLGHSYGGVVAQGYAIKYPEHLSHLVLADTFHSYIMWQENDDSSNREIKNSFPEIWDKLMTIREQGAVSSDKAHQDLYAQIPYGFLYAYNPWRFSGGAGKPYPNETNRKLYYQMVGKDGDFIVGSDIGNFDYRKKLRPKNACFNYYRPVRPGSSSMDGSEVQAILSASTIRYF